MRVTIILAAAALLLTACAEGPTRVEATNPTVTYRFNGDNELKEASGKAEQFCQGYSKSARLLHVTQRAGEEHAVFECV